LSCHVGVSGGVGGVVGVGDVVGDCGVVCGVYGGGCVVGVGVGGFGSGVLSWCCWCFGGLWGWGVCGFCFGFGCGVVGVVFVGVGVVGVGFGVVGVAFGGGVVVGLLVMMLMTMLSRNLNCHS